MKFEETNAYRLRAEHCAHQADLAQDRVLKKYWDDLADDWLALDSARIRPSFVSQKYSGHA